MSLQMLKTPLFTIKQHEIEPVHAESTEIYRLFRLFFVRIYIGTEIPVASQVDRNRTVYRRHSTKRSNAAAATNKG